MYVCSHRRKTLEFGIYVLYNTNTQCSYANYSPYTNVGGGGFNAKHPLQYASPNISLNLITLAVKRRNMIYLNR